MDFKLSIVFLIVRTTVKHCKLLLLDGEATTTQVQRPKSSEIGIRRRRRLRTSAPSRCLARGAALLRRHKKLGNRSFGRPRGGIFARWLRFLRHAQDRDGIRRKSVLERR